jgi:hypothetical protein
VTLLQNRNHDVFGMATTEMHCAWAGRAAGKAFVKLWGSDSDVLLGTSGWRNKLNNFIRNLTFLNSFDMSKANMQRYVETIRWVRPVIIEAYAEASARSRGISILRISSSLALGISSRVPERYFLSSAKSRARLWLPGPEPLRLTRGL